MTVEGIGRPRRTRTVMASTPEIGSEAPDFVLDGTSPEGRARYTLSDFRGRKVLLNSWASW